MPYRTIATEALEAWRDADRRMRRCAPESREWQEAFVEAELAKQRYNDAIAAAHAEHLPEPPPFDEAARRSDVAPPD